MECIYWRLFLHNCIFIRIVLDFYLNQVIGNYGFMLLKLGILKNLDIISLIVKSSLAVNLVISSIFLMVANDNDLKFGIIPNKLSLSLIVYGLIFNLFLGLLLRDIMVMIFSISLTALLGIVAFALWYIGFWGGGDFKIFIGLSLSLSFLDFSSIRLGHFNDVFKGAFADLNLPMSNQFIFYPKVFSILFNAILIAFASLLLVLMHHILKSRQLKYYSVLSILDFESFFSQLTTESIHIDDLSEGMVLDNYYFSNREVFDMADKVSENTGLKLRDEGDSFYFSSLNRIGLTEWDVVLIKDLYDRGLIENPNFKIKKAVPFMPFLTLGYFSFLLFGDFISLISSVIRSLF